MELEFHEIADMFPLMSDEEMNALVESIKSEGLLNGITLFEGKILDGRNRYNACKKLNKHYTTGSDFKGTYEEAIEFVWMENFHRRHLNPSQKAICINKKDDLVKRFEDEANERRKLSGGDKKSIKYKRLQKSVGELIPPSKSINNCNKKDNRKRVKNELAKLAGTNPHYITDAKKIIKEYPEKAKEIEKGKKTITQAKREIKKEEIKKQSDKSIITCTISDLNELIDKDIKCKTIYADPPWQYSNQATRSATDLNYTSMTIEQIMALPIKEIADKEAHLHLWTTNAFLFESKKILEAWGFEYKSIFIWVKPKIGIGNYWRVSHEFLILGTKGSLPFLDNSIRSWEEIKREKHSKKPKKIRQEIEKVSPAPRIELFSREVKAPKGWIIWGNEVEKGSFSSSINECVRRR